MSGFRHGEGRLGDATLNFTFDGKPMLARAGDTVLRPCWPMVLK